MLNPLFWHKEVMGEGVKAVSFGFNQMNLQSIASSVSPKTKFPWPCSMRQLLKEGYFKDAYFFKGIFRDTMVYTLVKPKL